MVGPALCSSHGCGYPVIMSVPHAIDYIVKPMSLLRLGCIQVVYYLSTCVNSVGDCQVIFCTKLQQEEAIGINISKAIVS